MPSVNMPAFARVRRRYDAPVRVTCAAVLLAVLALAGCGRSPSGVLQPNQAPHLVLTGGPTPGGTDYYAVAFRWNAWDDDGFVDHFLYAVDTTDTTWTVIRQHEVTLLFATPTPNSDGTYSGWHTFYVKAVDNEGRQSEISERTFNARTVAPLTLPLRPSKLAEGGGINAPLSGGATVRLEWRGEDPDGVEHSQPVAYQVVRVRADRNLAGDWEAARALCTGPGVEIVSLSGDSTSVIFHGLTETDATAHWLFWVRAIDEAGAMEPWPSRRNEWPGYFFFYFAQSRIQGPALDISSAALGEFTSQGFSSDAVEYVYNRPVSVRWEADASESGGDVDGFRWGVDVSDMDDPQDPGWATGWNRRLSGFTGLQFTDSSVPFHNIVIQARDTNGGITTSILQIHLTAFAFDRDVLFVDDELETSGQGLLPTDVQHQAYMRSVLNASLGAIGRSSVADVYSCFPDPTRQDGGMPPPLATLAHYRVVVWDSGRPTNTNTLYGLCAVSPTARPSKVNPLALYLEAGGSFVVSGFAPARSTVLTPSGIGTAIGPAEGLGPGTHNFAYDYWHLPARVRFEFRNVETNGLLSAEPTAWASDRGYPRLRFDAERWYRFASTGWTNTEALDASVPREVMEGDDLEPLYTFNSVAGKSGPGGSLMHSLVDVQLFRAAPTREGEDWHYEVVYAGFPWYLFRQEDVTEAFTHLLADVFSDRKWGTTAASDASDAKSAHTVRAGK
jgi:hypothetical protein